MTLVLSIIHVLACVLIIAVILLQSGRGGGLGAGFGGASSAATQLFGGRGAGNFLSRSTVALAVVFFVTSLWLAYISSRPNSLLDLTETAGAEASNAETVVERGSGPLIPLDEEGQPLEEGVEVPDEAVTPGPTGAEREPTKIDLSDALQMKKMEGAEEGAAPAEGADTAEEEPAGAEDEAPEAPEEESQPEAKPEPKPEAKPEPKPEAKPEPKPEAKPEPKPEAKPEPKPEAKPEEEQAEEAQAEEEKAEPAPEEAADESAEETSSE